RKKYYNNEIKDYCSDRFLLPLSKGEESVGHLYFDHGLMRLRKVSFDQYQLDEFGVLRINSDSDVLVYPNGKEFTIPEGYTLKGYSDGILTLERGGYYGYMNTAGKWICDPKYTNASAFHGGLGVLTKQNGKVGAVDINGNTVIPFRYSYVSNRSECLVAAYSEQNGWELFGIFTK
ncbi:MAG: WG repeat-containing protein, partial [Clostridia bacterium]|nr:WG repeat-containing protein [Clostridia bacterium]